MVRKERFFLGLLAMVVMVSASPEIRRSEFLSVAGRKFMYSGQKVYLSGTNAAWINYGADFGDNAWDDHGARWTQELEQVAAAGGNLVRVWVHVEGDHSPLYDQNGYVVGTDSADTLIHDLLAFLDECQRNNVFMGLVLFNGAVLRNQNTIDLFWDDLKLESYLGRALIPMVKALKGHPALGFWEVMNEAEGSMVPGVKDSDPCFDLTHLDWTRGAAGGPGFSGANLPLRGILKLHNWVAAAIHSLDPKALVTSGSWSPLATTNLAGPEPVHNTGFNHYSGQCLRTAGGLEDGIMDFVQFHNYPWDGEWQLGAPWLGLAQESYLVEGALLVGEFPARVFQEGQEGQGLPGGATTEELVDYLYSRDFAGGLSWALIPSGAEGEPGVAEDVLNGMTYLRGRTDHGNIDITIN